VKNNKKEEEEFNFFIFMALPLPPSGGCGSGYSRLTYLRPLARAWYGG
jgi:hypothetical protein